MYDAHLVSDLLVFKHDPLFALICIFLYADSPLSVLLKLILFLSLCGGTSLTAQMLKSVREQTDRQPRPLFYEPIMIHNLHVMRAEGKKTNNERQSVSQHQCSCGPVFLVESGE